MEEKILKVTQQALENCIEKELCGWNKPLTTIINETISKHEKAIKEMVDKCLVDIIYTDDFKVSLKNSLKEKFAKTIVNNMDGELVKRVNELKQDPTTRAKIILALDKLANEILSIKEFA